MRNHANKKEPEKPIQNQATDKELTPVRIRKNMCFYYIILVPNNIFAVHIFI